MYFAKKVGRTIGSVLLTAAILASQFSPLTTMVQAATPAQGYYVSVKDGADNNPGTLAKPFKTIQKAADTMRPGDTCYIRGGVYSETVVPKSGAQGNRITFTNYEDEIVTVSGCDQITGWVPDGKTEGIYKAKMDWSLGDKGDHNQVFVNGTLMYEARYPNVQPDDTLVDFTYARAGSGTGISKEIPPLEAGDTVPNRRGATSYLVDPEFKKFATTADFFDGAKIWMVPGAQWTSLTSYATSYDPAEGKITFPSTYRGMKNKSGYYTPKNGAPYYVFGAYKLLDTENEWWYDTATQMLHVKIANGANPDTAGAYIEAKRRLNAFDLSGCSFINITGINVRGSTVITDANSTYISMKDMKCEYVGHNSTMTLNSLTDNTSPQDDLGILLKGRFIEVDSCEISNSSGPVINLQGSDNSLTNCYVHDGNYIGTYCGHSKISGRRQFVSNNTLTRSGRDVLSFRDLSESVIQYNDISHAGYLTLDLGMMYAANTDGQNTLIHHNIIHDNHSAGNNNGFYPDEMTHNFIVYQNIVYGSKTGLVFNHPSLYNLAYNNTVYDRATLGDSYTATFKDDRGRQFMNNILTDASQKNNQPSIDSTFFRGNLLDGAPGFTDAANKDFRLTKESAAVGSGVPISGVTDPALENPSVGALEYGQESFPCGHNFENPPTIVKAPSVAAFEYRNLVKNGGFEFASIEDWAGDGTATFEDSWHAMDKIASTGYYGLVLQPGQSVTQTVEGLVPETEYAMALAARVSARGKTGTLAFGTADQLVTEEITGYKWATNTREFATLTTGKGATTLAITVKNTGANVLYVDDIGMQKVAKDTGALSQPVSFAYDKATYEMAVSFAPLAEGHRYYYSDLQTQDSTFTQGKFIATRPAAYATELKSGDKVMRIFERYLNIVEVNADNMVIGYGNLQAVNAMNLKPLQDTFVNTADPLAVPAGEEINMLRLNGNPQDGARTGYVQFDLTKVAPGTLLDAKLHLYVYQTNPAGGAMDYSRKVVVQVMPEEGTITEGHAAWSEKWNEATLVYGKPVAEGGQGVIAKPTLDTVIGPKLSTKITEPNGVTLELDVAKLLKDKCGQKVTLQLSNASTRKINSDMYIPSKENAKYAQEEYQTKLLVTAADKVANIEAVAPIEPIVVDYGTKFEDLKLPKQASVTVANSETPAMLAITWDKGNYDETVADPYVLTGTLNLVDGIVNADNKAAIVQVTVKQKPLEGPSLDELKTLIQTAETKKAEDYTAESFAALQEAVTAAKIAVAEVETALQPTIPPAASEPAASSAPTAPASSEPAVSSAPTAPAASEPAASSAPTAPAASEPAVSSAPTAPAEAAPIEKAAGTEIMLLSVQTAPETVPETAPETVPETTPETVPETTPETVPETTPETVPETTPETVPETTPETVPETTPETIPETTPETAAPNMTDALQAKINVAYQKLSDALNQLVKRIFFTVQFVDERGETLPSVQVEQGTTIPQPQPQPREGYEFGGWYTDDTCTVKFDFAKAIVGNEIIFAKWTSITPPTPDPDPVIPTPDPVPPTPDPVIPTPDPVSPTPNPVPPTNPPVNPVPNPKPNRNPNHGTPSFNENEEELEREITAKGMAGGKAMIPPEVDNVKNPEFFMDELTQDSEEFKNFVIAGAGYTPLKAFDIRLHSDGKPVTQVEGGKITVSIPFDGKERETYYVLRYNADKTVTEIPATYANGMLTFVTDHFSLYAIALKTETVKEKPAQSTASVSSQAQSQPETVPEVQPEQKGGFNWLLLVIALLAVSAIGVVLIIRNRNRR